MQCKSTLRRPLCLQQIIALLMKQSKKIRDIDSNNYVYDVTNVIYRYITGSCDSACKVNRAR